MELKKDTLYISFHRPSNVIGALISAWTVGPYAHAEFIYNGEVYLANPGGVRKSPFTYQKNFDIYEVDKVVSFDKVLEFFKETEGKEYDWLAIFLSQFMFSVGAESESRYFCSEWCLNAIYLACDSPLTYNLKDLKAKGFNKFSPNRLHKYLKFMELITYKEV